jgi:hypothetical protein
MVKGAIVARNVSFEATMDNSRLDEFRKEIRGRGGITIGPFHGGGSGAKTEYGRDYQTQAGTYGRATDFSAPVIVALITEPTVTPNAAVVQPVAASSSP